MHLLPQIVFTLCLGAAGYFFITNVLRIRRNILLGRDLELLGPSNERMKAMLLIAFGQKKMFDRPLVAFMHLIIYLGFIIINIEILEIILDGLLGTHRVFAPALGDIYLYLINIFEWLAVGVLVVCIVFLLRRNILRINRFWGPEMTSWPRTDANTILVIEILLMVAFLSMNAADLQLQTMGEGHYTQTGSFAVSGTFAQTLFGTWSVPSLIVYERFAWWAHILGVMSFATYVTYSKHLHIFLAFPNTYYSNLGPVGKLRNMPEVTVEVKSMLGIEATATVESTVKRFGAKDATDLTWKNLLDAYTCTECGRCSSVCPANTTGKKLSPRKIMMDTRDRIEEIGYNVKQNGGFVDDGKSLLDTYISREEILACTTCNACVDACPVNINPVDIICQLRRYSVMEESNAPSQWNAMFSNLETSFSPWKFSPSDRFNWAKETNN